MIYLGFAILFILEFSIIFFIKIIPVLKRTFPLDAPEAVLFTLSQNVLGARDFAIELVKESFYDAFIIQIVCLLLFVLLFISVYYYRKKRDCKKIYYRIFGYLHLIYCLAILIILLHSIVVSFPIRQYIAVYGTSLNAKPHSSLYQHEFANPEKTQINFLKKKNLLLIFLESIEVAFQDSANGGGESENLIPEITTYMKYYGFGPGGNGTFGTGWTMGAIVGKTCGIPLYMPPGMDGNMAGRFDFLPGIECLTDVLAKNDYNMEVLQGSRLKFASFQHFLKTHGNPNAYGFEFWQNSEKYKNEKFRFWGLPDKLLFEEMKVHLNELAKKESPFFLWGLTIDTHSPYGFLDSSCANFSNIPESEQYPLVIRCSSKMLSDFLNWVSLQSWYENTVVVVMGDHPTMSNLDILQLNKNTTKRLWVNFFINSEKNIPQSKRVFTSFDMYPTILEAMGVDIKGHKLGLGVSLFDSTKTLSEKYGLDSLNKMLRINSLEYDQFMYRK